MIKKLVTYLFFLGITISAFSQEIKLEANAPKVVEVGEQFQVQFTVNGQPSNFIVREMKDFNLLMGPSTSQSTNMSWVNGKVTQSVSYTYTYVFQAVKAGKYLIGSAEVTVGGKKYKSNSFTIEVIGSGSAQPSTQQNQTPNQSSNQSETVATDGEVFLRLLVDKKNVYQGEYLNATVKLYTKLNISSAGRVSPAFNGFFVQELEIPQPRLELENVNGQKWYTATLNKFVLIPQKSGAIKLDPLQIDVVVQREVRSRQRGFFDDFFGPSVQEAQVKLKTLPITINVKPLPTTGKPESFAGAVGRFSFDAKIDKNKVKTNDAITLKLTLSGTGNIKLIEAPNIVFPTDFETYDPKINLNTAKSSGDISGIKTFEYLLIPRNPGDFKLSPISFSYFDPSANQYKTVTTDAFDIAVEKGDETQSAAVVSGLSKEDVKFVGKDILFIKVGNIKLFKTNNHFFGSILFYIIYTIALLAFVIIIILRRRIIKQNANIAFVRNKRADKFASKRLKQARIHLHANEKEKFYEELLKGIWGYLSDKLNIPLADLSRDTAKELLTNKALAPEALEKFIDLVNSCEYARYAPASSDTLMKEDYQKAIEIITTLQQKLR